MVDPKKTKCFIFGSHQTCQVWEGDCHCFCQYTVDFSRRFLLKLRPLGLHLPPKHGGFFTPKLWLRLRLHPGHVGPNQKNSGAILLAGETSIFCFNIHPYRSQGKWNLLWLISFKGVETTRGGFLKWWYPTTMGFPTKYDQFGVFWGHHHLRKHPPTRDSLPYDFVLPMISFGAIHDFLCPRLEQLERGAKRIFPAQGIVQQKQGILGILEMYFRMVSGIIMTSTCIKWYSI